MEHWSSIEIITFSITFFIVATVIFSYILNKLTLSWMRFLRRKNRSLLSVENHVGKRQEWVK